MLGRRERQRFDRWGDFLAFCESPTDMPAEGRASCRRKYSDKWRGASPAEAYRMAREGWPEGVTRARGLSEALFDRVSTLLERFDTSYGVEPTGALDVARYLDAEPECWAQFTPVLVEGPGTRHLTLLMNQAVSAGIDVDTIIAKGAVAAALIDVLEVAGHRVKVVLGAACETAEIYHATLVTIKEHEQPLDLDRLTFALAHPASFRVLMFSAWEHYPADVRRAAGIEPDEGYGRPVACDAVEADITIGHSDYQEPQWTDPASATAWILAELARQTEGA